MIKKLLLLLISLVLIPIIAYNGFKHYQESQKIKQFINENGWSKKPPTWDLAIEISDTIRQQMNTQSATFIHVDRVPEPFLSYSCLDILDWMEGTCGKGARVLVKVLTKCGFDATRISLYGKGFGNSTSHTLVSIIINGEEYFIDTVNAPEGFNDMVRNHQLNTKKLNIASYINRRGSAENSHDSITTAFQNKFCMYNYEAIQLSKVMKLAGLDVWGFNMKRPPATISNLVESIYLIHVIFLSTIWIVLNLLWLVLFRFKTQKRKK